MSGSDEEARLARYLAFEQSVLQHAISLADSKAAFLLAISTAATGVCLNLLNRSVIGADSSTTDAMLRLSASIFALGALVALAVIAPRIVTRRAINAIYWGGSPFRQTSNSFVVQIRADESLTNIDALLAQLHRLARVAREKYELLWAVIALVILGMASLAISQTPGTLPLTRYLLNLAGLV